MRLLAPVALQPRSRRGRQEPLHPRLQDSRLGQVRGLPQGRGALRFRTEAVSRRGCRTLRCCKSQRPVALQQLPAPLKAAVGCKS